MTDETLLNEAVEAHNIPFVLVMKRKTVRLFPGGVTVALYKNDKTGLTFAVPFNEDGTTGKPVVNPLPMKEEEEFTREVIAEDLQIYDKIKDIAKNGVRSTIQFASGQTSVVDGYTAAALVKVYHQLTPDRQNKLKALLASDSAGFMKAVDFAFQHSH